MQRLTPSMVILTGGLLFFTACSERERPRPLSELLALSAPAPSPSVKMALQPEELVISPKSVQLTVGRQSNLFSQVRDPKGSTKVLTASQVQFTSGNSGVATVEPSGVIVAVGPGKTAILAEFENMIASVPVVVTEDPDALAARLSPNLKPTLTPGQLLAPLQPTPIPTPELPALERVTTVVFTSQTVGTGLKMTAAFLDSNKQALNWDWDGDTTFTYTVYSVENWTLTAENVKARLNRQTPFVIAEGEFDSVHDKLKKGGVSISCEVQLPNGKVLSLKREPVVHQGTAAGVIIPVPSPS